MPTSGHTSMSSRIESADNGYVIRISAEHGGKKPSYTSRTLVATSPRQAERLAKQHIQLMEKKVRTKRSRGKRLVGK